MHGPFRNESCFNYLDYIANLPHERVFRLPFFFPIQDWLDTNLNQGLPGPSNKISFALTQVLSFLQKRLAFFLPFSWNPPLSVELTSILLL